MTDEPNHQPPLLTRFLADRDVACPRCGYNLRNLTGDRCPECGDALRLQVGLADPRLAAYITALVGASLGLGGSGLFSLVALAAAPGSWWSTFSGRLLLAMVIVTAPMTAALLAQRQRFRRLPSRAQWWVAFCVCVSVVVSSATVIGFFDG